MSRRSLATLERAITSCRACPRLVEWRERVARDKRKAYRDETYWGKPVPGFGDPNARIVVVGLAPGAHGGNRTGRVFTGDRSGDFLYAALHRRGLASQPESERRDDGLVLRDCFITLAARCVPPDNKPAPGELATCRPWLAEELEKLVNARVIFALGKLAYDQALAVAKQRHGELEAPPFAHGARATIPSPRGDGTTELFASYHVSQQNTQTGRLTPAMFDAVLAEAIAASR